MQQQTNPTPNPTQRSSGRTPAAETPAGAARSSPRFTSALSKAFSPRKGSKRRWARMVPAGPSAAARPGRAPGAPRQLVAWCWWMSPAQGGWKRDSLPSPQHPAALGAPHLPKTAQGNLLPAPRHIHNPSSSCPEIVHQHPRGFGRGVDEDITKKLRFPKSFYFCQLLPHVSVGSPPLQDLCHALPSSPGPQTAPVTHRDGLSHQKWDPAGLSTKFAFT